MGPESVGMMIVEFVEVGPPRAVSRLANVATNIFAHDHKSHWASIYFQDCYSTLCI
jgi:hypothetical protein